MLADMDHLNTGDERPPTSPESLPPPGLGTLDPSQAPIDAPASGPSQRLNTPRSRRAQGKPLPLTPEGRLSLERARDLLMSAVENLGKAATAKTCTTAEMHLYYTVHALVKAAEPVDEVAIEMMQRTATCTARGYPGLRPMLNRFVRPEPRKVP